MNDFGEIRPGLFLSNCSHIEIKNCNFSWMGGCYYPIQTFMHSDRLNPVRMGNGVRLWRGNSDVNVHHCFFNQVYDAAIIGEWHTSFSTKISPTVQEVMANMDVYLKNYSSSQLVVCDDLLYYGKIGLSFVFSPELCGSESGFLPEKAVEIIGDIESKGIGNGF